MVRDRAIPSKTHQHIVSKLVKYEGLTSRIERQISCLCEPAGMVEYSLDPDRTWCCYVLVVVDSARRTHGNSRGLRMYWYAVLVRLHMRFNEKGWYDYIKRYLATEQNNK